jgi:tripartite-type tricarboxylate transporter receptor subunit TctC
MGVAEKVSALSSQVAQSAGFVEAVGKLGFEPTGLTGRLFNSQIKDSAEAWTRRIKSLCILS